MIGLFSSIAPEKYYEFSIEWREDLLDTQTRSNWVCCFLQTAGISCLFRLAIMANQVNEETILEVLSYPLHR
jgi:hypothetical protein